MQLVGLNELHVVFLLNLHFWPAFGRSSRTGLRSCLVVPHLPRRPRGLTIPVPVLNGSIGTRGLVGEGSRASNGGRALQARSPVTESEGEVLRLVGDEVAVTRHEGGTATEDRAAVQASEGR